MFAEKKEKPETCLGFTKHQKNFISVDEGKQNK